MADRRDWGGGVDDPEESTQRVIERIWESLTDIRARMDQQAPVPPVAVPPGDGEAVPVAPVPPRVEVPLVAPVPPPPPVLIVEEPVMQVEKFLRLQPPTYSGGPYPDTAEHWIHEIERVFATMRCLAADRVVLGAYQLRGFALEWWRLKMQTSFAGRTEEAITWVLHDELSTTSSLPRCRSLSGRPAGRSTKLHRRRKTRGRPLPSEKRGKGGKERKRKRGKPAKAFSLRFPKRDGAGHHDTNLIATAAQTATRTCPSGAPRQLDRSVCHAFHSDRRQMTKTRKHYHDPLIGRDKNATQKAVATGMTVATGTSVTTRPVIPHTTESRKARDVTPRVTYN
ncbi:hypothetical protein Taro_033512 [Colocasia esculenta]|uniref:Retrotransposon gag domain-containing protein n=1 Tax=Colocasia esculenta TaxID=4460 RepID=A0A843W4Y4_COLES|nr:hypothetical protein [Colocasia esculenta]